MELPHPDALRLFRRVFQLNRVLRQVIEQPLLASTGLTSAELFVLRAVALGFDRPSRIARRMAMAPPNVSRALATLERRGLIARVEDAADRRQTIVTVTAAAAEVLARVEAVAVAALEAASPSLEPEAVVRGADALDEVWRQLALDAAVDDAAAPARDDRGP
jgi:MarR family transcriptional regulator, transcriptional regulator for hemolysin